MNKLSRNVEYALIALHHMEKHKLEQLLNVKRLSTHMKVPFDPLSRVMQKLAKKKLIESEQGPQGGYRLTCDFSEVTLHELMLTIEGPIGIARCLSDATSCDLSKSCEVKSPISYLNEKLVLFYKNMTLRELFSVSSDVSVKEKVIAL